MSDGRASVVGTEECLRGKGFLHLKQAAAAPEAARRLCGFLGNDHPQEFQACPSALGSMSQPSSSLVDAAKDRCPSTVWKLARQNVRTEIPPEIRPDSD